MELTTQEYLIGSSSVIIVAIFLIVGLTICFKYFEKRDRIFILVGISWIALAIPWSAVAIHFLMLILLDMPLQEEIFFFIIGGIIPFTQICWIMAFSEFTSMVKRNKIKLLVISLSLSITFEIIFLYILFNDVSLIGRFEGAIHIKFTLFFTVYLTIMALIFEIVGIFFVRESLKLDDPEIRLKAKFLIIAFILFFIGCIPETIIMNISITVIGRIILIFSALAFYCGFILPSWIKERLLEETKGEHG